MPNVRCTVSDCVHWDEGNLCAAELIWVTLDRLAAASDVEVGELDGMQTEARRSSATCCHTYKPRAGATVKGE